MKRFRKKIAAVVLAMVLMVAMAVPAFAVSSHIGIPLGQLGYWNPEQTNFTLNAFASSSADNHTNVTTWPKDYSRSQRWTVRRTADNHYYITTDLSKDFALDYFWGASNNGNCDLYSVTDAAGNFNTDA